MRRSFKKGLVRRWRGFLGSLDNLTNVRSVPKMVLHVAQWEGGAVRDTCYRIVLLEVSSVEAPKNPDLPTSLFPVNDVILNSIPISEVGVLLSNMITWQSSGVDAISLKKEFTIKSVTSSSWSSPIASWKVVNGESSIIRFEKGILFK